MFLRVQDCDWFLGFLMLLNNFLRIFVRRWWWSLVWPRFGFLGAYYISGVRGTFSAIRWLWFLLIFFLESDYRIDCVTKRSWRRRPLSRYICEQLADFVPPSLSWSTQIEWLNIILLVINYIEAAHCVLVIAVSLELGIFDNLGVRDDRAKLH